MHQAMQQRQLGKGARGEGAEHVGARAGRGEGGGVVEAQQALNKLGDEYLRRAGHHGRNDNPLDATQRFRRRLAVGSLARKVELRENIAFDVLDEPAEVVASGLHHPAQSAKDGEVSLKLRRQPRVLHLERDAAAVVHPRIVHLREGGGADWELIGLFEQLARAVGHLLSHERRDNLERLRGRVVRELGERLDKRRWHDRLPSATL
mmetsp:Transcript_46313/g.122072  ORF Transcript_46313/g.122072 Transcript_46313/m.122072 type:complete len:206 (+) Transcript_46313:745-1362(+)